MMLRSAASPGSWGRSVSYDKNGILVPSSCLTDPHFNAAPDQGAAFLIRAVAIRAGAAAGSAAKEKAPDVSVQRLCEPRKAPKIT